MVAQGEGKSINVKKPKLRRRSGSLPPGGVKLVSDEAPEATCLSSFMWLLPAPRSAFLSRSHASLWQGGDGPWNLRSRDDRARVRLRRHTR